MRVRWYAYVAVIALVRCERWLPYPLRVTLLPLRLYVGTPLGPKVCCSLMYSHVRQGPLIPAPRLLSCAFAAGEWVGFIPARARIYVMRRYHRYSAGVDLVQLSNM
ncbi:hypothetical protein B0J17DRAFT_663097 [Rhizoctonia solani]|nr:hypothetical protein B0J17DRAFT_663097 [Rhizoctonia solani]